MKKRLRELLENRQLEEIADLAANRKRILGELVSLTYDSNALIAWRAVEAMGIAADRITDDDPAYVLSLLRRLYWLLSEESGGIGWFSPQAMAEIIRRRPRVFSEYLPIVVSLLVNMADEDLDFFRPGVLWAIGQLAPVAGEEVESVLPAVVECLDNLDPRVRGMAVWCLKQAGKQDLLTSRTDLLSDDGPLDIYEDGNLKRTHVGALMPAGPA